MTRRTMRLAAKALLHSVMAGFLALCTVLPSSAQNTEAIATVDGLHAGLLDIMQNAESLGFTGRRDRIAPIIHASLDLPFITRLAIGRHWKGLAATEREAIVDVFSRWTVGHYAARFNGYSGERFAFVSAEQSRKQRELVRTVLEVSDDASENVTLDYLLHEKDGKWRIINVIANGVSDLTLKRADYGAVIEAEGLEGLITKLEDQISGFANE
jgi:phospholipid transport system substrate-binding protein